MKKYNALRSVMLYLFAFVTIQFLTTYAVFFAWQLARGTSLGDTWHTFASGGMHFSFRMLLVVQALYSLAVMAAFGAMRWCEVSPTYLRTRPWGVMAWAAVAAMGTIVPSEVMDELLPLPDWSEGNLAQMLGSRWGYLVICIFAPLVEELVFRGAILRALLRGCRNHWVAIAASSLLFALVHANPAQMPHAFLMGLMLGWMYYRTQSVVPGMVTHWVNNTVAYVVYNVFPQSAEMRLVDLWGGDTRRVAMAVAFSLLILVPALVQLHFRMRRADEH